MNESDIVIISYFVGLIVGFATAVVVGIIIGKDANRRGMSGGGWGFFAFAFMIIGVPIYLVVRKPYLKEYLEQREEQD